MKLSIVVNMYNTAKYMPKCMDSLLEQDIDSSEYEIILVNDGSTDESLSLAKRYLSESEQNTTYPKIKIVDQENKGLAAARNAGVDVATGTYLCFVDPDDYIEKNSLKSLLEQMDNHLLDVLRFNYQKVDEEYNNLPDYKAELKFDYSPGVMTGIEFLRNRLGVACYVWPYIYKLDLIKGNNIRFIENCYFDDTPWLPRVLQKAKRVECNPIRHQYYLQRQGSMVRTNNIESIKRKVEGQIKLLSSLNEQMIVADIDINYWYKKMISHIIISILTTISVHLYSDRLYYIKQIEDLKVLPISTKDLSINNYLKSQIINLSPDLYCWTLYMMIYKK